MLLANKHVDLRTVYGDTPRGIGSIKQAHRIAPWPGESCPAHDGELGFARASTDLRKRKRRARPWAVSQPRKPAVSHKLTIRQPHLRPAFGQTDTCGRPARNAVIRSGLQCARLGPRIPAALPRPLITAQIRKTSNRHAGVGGAAKSRPLVQYRGKVIGRAALVFRRWRTVAQPSPLFEGATHEKTRRQSCGGNGRR